jgi:outer membrane protein OmpA-like peptidoglycan-associated protein
MKLNECCKFVANKALYAQGEKEGCTKGLKESKLIVEIPLEKLADVVLQGVVYDQVTGLPLSGAVVTLSNDCGKATTDTLTTDASGKYMFKLDRDCCYKVKAEKINYLGASSEMKCTKNLGDTTVIQVDLNLQPLIVNPLAGTTPKDSMTTKPGGSEEVVANETTPKKGKSKKKKTKEPITFDSTTGEYIDPNTGKPANGKFNGITYKDGKIIKSGNSIFEPSPTPVGENGEISYLLHIYYDFDQSFIRTEALPELEKLMKMLSDNPSLIIELSSHTDSRGSNSYNNRLSQRRAEAVVRWLVARGVDRDRLVPRGYGETVNVNNCANEVPCSEKEHQYNRRTEFRVLGCRTSDCYKGAPTLSQPKANPKVDNCHGCPF